MTALPLRRPADEPQPDIEIIALGGGLNCFVDGELVAWADPDGGVWPVYELGKGLVATVADRLAARVKLDEIAWDRSERTWR